MYAWLFRRLPGPLWLRIVIATSTSSGAAPPAMPCRFSLMNGRTTAARPASTFASGAPLNGSRQR